LAAHHTEDRRSSISEDSGSARNKFREVALKHIGAPAFLHLGY